MTRLVVVYGIKIGELAAFKKIFVKMPSIKKSVNLNVFDSRILFLSNPP